MGGGAPATKDDKNTLYCSFCRKSQHEVIKLISGPTVFICDECVGLCVDILTEEKTVFGPSLEKSLQLDRVRTEIKEALDLIDAVAGPQKKMLEETIHRLSVLGGLRKKLTAFLPPEKPVGEKAKTVLFPTPTPPLES